MRLSRFLLVFITIFTQDMVVKASEFLPYSREIFEEVQKQDKNILLQYHASWCPICKRQRNVLETLTKDPAFSKVEFISANYDTDKDVRKQFAVKGQSTLILFQGAKELKRSQGVTDAAELTEFLKNPRAEK
jgi:thiol-disulfide isomerase/thioredoxin